LEVSPLSGIPLIRIKVSGMVEADRIAQRGLLAD
jgi:hypothetical protein